MNAARFSGSLLAAAMIAACGPGAAASNATGVPGAPENPSAPGVAKRVGPGIVAVSQHQAMSHAAPQAETFATVEGPGGVAVLDDGSVLVVSEAATGATVYRLSSDGQLAAEAPLPTGTAGEWDGARIEAWGSRGYVLARSGRMALVFVEGEQIIVEQANADFTDLVDATVPDAYDLSTGEPRELALGTPTFGDLTVRPSGPEQDFVDLYASGLTTAEGANGAVPFVAQFRIDYDVNEATYSRVVAVGAAVGGPMAIPVSEIASANTFGVAVLMAADRAEDVVLAALPTASGSALVVIPSGDAQGSAPYPLIMSDDGQPFSVTASGMAGSTGGVVIPVSSGRAPSCSDSFSGVVTIAPPNEGALSISCVDVAFPGPVQDAAFDATSEQLFVTLDGSEQVGRVGLAISGGGAGNQPAGPQFPSLPDFINP